MGISALPLTEREKQVAHWIAEGKTNWEIARILDVSESTVRNHVHNILEKTMLVNRTAISTQLVRNELPAFVNRSGNPALDTTNQK